MPLRQRNLVASARAIVGDLRLSPATTSSHCVMPLFHVHGLVASTLAPLASGGTVSRPRRFTASAFWDDVRRARRDLVLGRADDPPHPALARRGRPTAPPGTACASRARAPRRCPARSWSAFEEPLRLPLVEAYGMTEAAHQMASNPLPPASGAPGSVGAPTGAEVAILDDDWQPRRRRRRGRGRACAAPASSTAIAPTRRRTRPASATAGSAPATRAALAGRLPHARRAAQGADQPRRREDLAARGRGRAARRTRRSPRPSRSRVPDAKYGETVGAAVVARSAIGEDALRAHCAERLAAFKVPARDPRRSTRSRRGRRARCSGGCWPSCSP